MIGDGGFVFALEKRGYVKAGPWTPEAAVEHPEAGWCLAHKRELQTDASLGAHHRTDTFMPHFPNICKCLLGTLLVM